MAVFPYILHRYEALELGIKFYYSGRPCRNGHEIPRYTSTQMCLGCRRMHEKSKIASDPESHRAKARKWYANNPDKGRAMSAAHRAKDPEYHRARCRAWVKSNPERHRLNTKRWCSENPLAIRAHSNNRRARKLYNGGTYTATDVEEIMKMQRGRCGYCRISLLGKYHVDHITPLKSGGSNGRSNLQILCPPCNLSKSARDPIVFAQSLGMLL